MIDREHPSFDVPADDVVIWRYMDLARFMSLLQTGSLWLARLDLLGDPHEGAFSYPTVQAREVWVDSFLALARSNGAVAGPGREEMLAQLGTRKSTSVSVNCWHMNPNESAAMWRIYQQEGRGVAVRSTVGRLDAALRNDEKQPLYLGKVEYINYATTFIPDRNVFDPIVRKRLSFEYEREVRLVTMSPPTYVANTKDPDGPPAWDWEAPVPPGVSVPVDLEILVDTVYIAPDTQDWFAQVVKNVVTTTDISCQVIRSSMDDSPLF
ncbi:DUF2971 domain-containing protein [Nocardioides sp. WS12]|uniref:DUF2971 domain-containing protein n=1 Tax=Nocardioides sp. WS12 TaxID=2486272 RepID=UPI0015FC2374|nr:DUF2971 domain-containing protein [Nocardioides sp. WS12]